jgi:hypothetical protein
VRVVFEHAVEVSIAPDRQLEPDPEAVQRCFGRPDQLQVRDRPADAGHLVLVLERLEREVISEPLRLFVRIRVTPHPDEQRGVIHDRPVSVIETEPFRESERDQALAQDVLHRLAEPQIDPQRQRRHQLREANMSPIQLVHSGRGYSHHPRIRSGPAGRREQPAPARRSRRARPAFRRAYAASALFLIASYSACVIAPLSSSCLAFSISLAAPPVPAVLRT